MSQPVRVDPEQPYVILGYQVQEIMALLQDMPRSTDRICKQIEGVVLSVQMLKPAETTEAPVTAPPTL